AGAGWRGGGRPRPGGVPAGAAGVAAGPPQARHRLDADAPRVARGRPSPPWRRAAGRRRALLLAVWLLQREDRRAVAARALRAATAAWVRAQARRARRRPWADQRPQSARAAARSCDPGRGPRAQRQQRRAARGMIPVTSCPGVTDVNATTPSTEGGPLHARFDGPIVMIGFGSIGKGTLPLIERHFAFDRSKFVVIAPDDSDRRLLDERQIRFIHRALTKENYRDILTPLL